MLYQMPRSILRSVAPLLMAAVVGCFAVPSYAAMDGPVNEARQMVQAGKPADAYRLLQPLTAGRLGDPDFDYVLGLAAVDSGRPAEAIIAFQRVLAVQPANGAARAELARAYAMGGDAETARREFATVAGDPTLPDPVRQRFTSIIGNLDRSLSGGGDSLTGYMEAGLGYDTNVNSATDQTSLIIPLFSGLGPANLSGSAVESEDAYAQVSAGLSFLHNLDRQNRVFVSALGAARENMDEDQFNTASLTATGGYAHTFATRSVAAVSAQAQEFWFSGDRYRESIGVTGQFTVPVGSAAIASSIQYFDINYKTDPLRDGDRLSAGLTYSWRSGIAGLQIGKEEVDSPVAQHFSNDFGSLSVAMERPVTGRVTVVAALSGEARKYDAADPLFLLRRDDTQIDASLGLRIPVAKVRGALLSVRPQVTYTSNSSNIALYDYDRIVGSVSLRAEF